MKSRSRASAPSTVKRTVPRGRLPNAQYRTREYLTEREVERLMKELRALRRLQREQKLGRYVFMSERGAPMSAVAFRRMVTRLGPAAKMSFGIHPHMLRHSTGF